MYNFYENLSEFNVLNLLFLFYRYYIGIIDIFTEYGFRQKLGRILKTIKFCNCNHDVWIIKKYLIPVINVVPKQVMSYKILFMAIPLGIVIEYKKIDVIISMHGT